MTWVPVVIFALTYALISARRLSWLGLDRPAGALLGAFACVATGVLTPEQALAAIDGSTLLLLFGVMGMGAFLAIDGFFEQLEARLVAVARSPARLLGLVLWASGLLSALLTNDAVCLLSAPLLVRLIQRHQLAPLPFLLALAMGANTGSVATLVGNPQNMLCATLGGLSYREHLVLVGPLALVCLGVNHAWLWALFRADLPARTLIVHDPIPRMPPRIWWSLVVLVGSTLAYVAGANLPWAATGGFVLLMLVHRRDTAQLWPRIDWSLLLFFAGLFVAVAGLMRSGWPELVLARAPWPGEADQSLGAWSSAAAVFLFGSNLVSNVPFILVVRDHMAALGQPRLAWELLAVASTFAGNLTLLGSVANIIVAQSAREIGGIGFRDHLRVGLPLTLVTTSLGLLWLWLGLGSPSA